MTTSTPTIALFGATGGTGLALLRLFLSASMDVTVLVRNEVKLLSLLGLQTPPPNLRIVRGSITSPAAVRSALCTKSGGLVDIAISCIGMSFDFSSFPPWKGIDLHLCENTARVIADSISSQHSEMCQSLGAGFITEGRPKKPLLIVLSTTGITKQRDIPLAMVPFYHYVLSAPHVDKAAAEAFLISLPDNETEQTQDWIIVRPSLLQGSGKGEISGKKIRVGVENLKEDMIEEKEVGYVISREDVAGWMFENIVCEEKKRKWVGKAISLTW